MTKFSDGLWVSVVKDLRKVYYHGIFAVVKVGSRYVVQVNDRRLIFVETAIVKRPEEHVAS